MSKVGSFLICLLLFSLFPKYVDAFYDPDMPMQNQIVVPMHSGLITFQQISNENPPQRYIVFGSGHISDITSAAKNIIYEASSNHESFVVGIFQQNEISSLKLKGYNVIEDLPLDFDSIRPTGSGVHDASRIDEILGTEKVIKYGYTGKGIKIGIVDQGTDFSNPDMQDSIARDGNNIPIMIDADGQGLVLTNQTFIANIDNYGIIRNNTHSIPKGSSSVYVTTSGIFLDLNKNGQGTVVQVFNSNYPKGGTPVINGTVSNDYKIGKDTRHYIVSKSGIYHFGIIYESVTQGQLSRLQLVPVLVVDSKMPGIYDTIIPDMSDSWKDFMKFDNPGFPQYDFDFTDETPIILGKGKEFLTYASHPKGSPDYSAGTVGAYVLDLYGVISNATTKIDKKIGALNGTLLPPLDPKGNFFGVMYDFGGHGTATAASIISQGKQAYNIYNNGTKYVIKGVAPGAKIVPIKALWLGDAIYGWLWAAGFDQDRNYWKYAGEPRVDILSNSWGISTFPALQSVPGFDIQSLLLSALDVPGSLDKNYPGILVVSSAGNAGPGYGTLGSPDAAPFGLTVGAATDNVFVGYGPFKNQPRFGNSTTYYGDVSGFSSKGPSVVGDPKPDLVAVGEYAFTPISITKFSKNSTGPFSIFGGTSLAAPLVAGSAAVLMQALNEKGVHYDPFMIKNILMSSAVDLFNDPFAQGSGLVNITNAVDFALGVDNTFTVENNASYSNIKKILDPAINALNSSSVGLRQFQLVNSSLSETSWFAGRLVPGDKTSATFTIENPNNDTLDIEISPQTINLIKTSQYDNSTEPHLQDPTLKYPGVYRPNYIPLASVNNNTNLLSFKGNKTVPSDSTLMVLDLSFPFSEFLNSTTKMYADNLKISSLYFYDWNSKTTQNIPTYKDLSLINRGGAWGTIQELRVSDPNSRIKHVPLVGVYPIPTIYSYWSGDTKINSTSLDYTLTASYFKKANWTEIWVDSKSVHVKPHSSVTVTVTLTVPNDQNPGVYQGFITFKGKSHTVNAPVSYVVLKQLQPKDLPTVIQGSDGNVLYGNGYVGGGFDMTNRYNAGDWREYSFDVKDETINSVTMIISWKQPDTNLSVFVIDPQGKIIQTNVPPGVLGQFQGWPTGDWLGPSTPFSEGGGFYPIKNKNATSTILYAPINQTGVYSILIHTTLFGGNSLTEPTTVYAKFSTILPEENAPQIELDLPQFINSTYTINPKIISGNIQDEKYYIDSVGPQTLNKTSLSESLAKLSEGDHDIKIVIADTVGHITSQDFKFFLDNTPPVITFKSPQNGSTVSGMINVSLDVNELNLPEKKWLMIKLSNQTIFDNNTLQFDTKSLQNGPHYIEAIATDKAGNLALKKITINVDNSGSVTIFNQNSIDHTITMAEILVGIAIASTISIIVFKKFRVPVKS